MKVLLTSGAGFIGSHVADQLLLAPSHEVAIVDDLSTEKKKSVPEGAMFYERDIRDGVRRSSRSSDPTPSATRLPRCTCGARQGNLTWART